MIFVTVIVGLVIVLIVLPTMWLLLNAHGRFGKNYVYLTFDDGPDPKVTPLILNILKRYGVKATFFVMGSKVNKYPEIIKAIIRGGHELGNHSYDHITRLGIYPPWVIKNEYLKCEQELSKITNKTPTFARLPQGMVTLYSLVTLKQMGYKVIDWSVEAKDWKDSVNKEDITKRIISKTKEGSVILLHDGLDNKIGSQVKVAESLPKILEALKKKDLKFFVL